MIGGLVSIDVWFRSYLPAPTPVAAEAPPDSALIAARARQDSAQAAKAAADDLLAVRESEPLLVSAPATATEITIHNLSRDL